MAFSFQSYKQLVTKIITREIAISWAKKRHKLTNSLPQNIRIDASETPGAITVDVSMFQYGAIQDKGVSASRIPFERGSGAGRSLYIDALTKYAEQRMGLSGKDAKSAAFAIATKQKKYGMRISDRGKGSGWLQQASDNLMPDFSNISSNYLGTIIKTTLERIKI